MINDDDRAWLQEQFENLRDDLSAYERGDYDVDMPEDVEDYDDDHFLIV